MITKEAIEAGCAAIDRPIHPDDVEIIITAVFAAMPAEREIDEGSFEEWTLADFAGQCRMQARDNLDPEYSQFMAALAARLSAFAAMPGPAVKTTSPQTHVVGSLWDHLVVLSGYHITQPQKPDHEFVQVCNGDLRKMVELMGSGSSPSSNTTCRWRAFEDTTPGYWGIELEDADNDDDAVMHPIKIHRDTVAMVVDAHNAAITPSPQPRAAIETSQDLAAENERLRAALERMECCCEQLAATRSMEIYTAMIDGGQAQALLELDNARREARAALERT